MTKGLSVVLALLAAPVLAQDPGDVAAMTTAIEEAGCVVTPENGDAVLEASGLTQEQTLEVIGTLYTEGLVALTADGNMKLTNEACP